MKKSDSKKTSSSQPSGAKGSAAGVQIANSSMEEMLTQLHQIIAQITDNSSYNADSDENKQLMALTNQLAANLQQQDKDAGESAMQSVLGIVDTLADMLENGQLSISANSTGS